MRTRRSAIARFLPVKSEYPGFVESSYGRLGSSDLSHAFGDLLRETSRAERSSRGTLGVSPEVRHVRHIAFRLAASVARARKIPRVPRFVDVKTDRFQEWWPSLVRIYITAGLFLREKCTRSRRGGTSVKIESFTLRRVLWCAERNECREWTGVSNRTWRSKYRVASVGRVSGVSECRSVGTNVLEVSKITSLNPIRFAQTLDYAARRWNGEVQGNGDASTSE